MENQPTEQNEAKEEGESSDARQSSGSESSSGTDRQEIEWQYDAPYGLEKVEEWLGSRDPEGFGLTVLGGSFKELTDTYYDTEGWRLYRAGYALRVRQETSGSIEATVKSLLSAGSGHLHKRREISELLERDEVGALLGAPGPVGELLRELLEARAVRPIFEVHTRRQTFDLLLEDAVRVGEVALDDSEIPLGDGASRLTRVEVEVDAATHAPRLKGFVKAMEVALGLRPTEISKYEAGLFVTGQNPDGKASPETKARRLKWC